MATSKKRPRRAKQAPRRGSGGPRGRRRRPQPKSFLEVWERTWPLKDATIAVSFDRSDGGEPLAELDIFAETEGRRPVGLSLSGLVLPGVSSVEGLAGQVLVDGAPPPELMPIGLAPSPAPLPAVSPTPGPAAPGPEASAPAEAPDDDARLAAERTAYVPGHWFDVCRLRLELGEPRDGRLEALLHLEADAYDEAGEVDDIDVPIVCVLGARLELPEVGGADAPAGGWDDDRTP